MAISTTMATAMSLAATAASTALGVYSSIQQGKAKSEQARYQAEVARQNQELAERQASEERMAGFEEAQAVRRKAAQAIGAQRAAAGASGAAVDVGSNLDLQADTAAQGEMDAINAYNRGVDSAYASQLRGWNYGQQAAGLEAKGEAAKQSAYLSAGRSALGGIADLGSTWGRPKMKGTPGPGNTFAASGAQKKMFASQYVRLGH